MNPNIFGRGTWFMIFNMLYHYYLSNIRKEPNEVFPPYEDLEDLKKKIYEFVSSLPCEECKIHSLNNFKTNKVIESDSFLYIFHYFIELRNSFYNNKINRKDFNTYDDLLINRKKFFENILKE